MVKIVLIVVMCVVASPLHARIIEGAGDENPLVMSLASLPVTTQSVVLVQPYPSPDPPPLVTELKNYRDKYRVGAWYMMLGFGLSALRWL
ncbi:MAG: hypothetical protein O3A01_06350 [bacterium]|nr:hypothetical protein [bacterium]